jgi:hypothetical protein
MEGEVFYFRAEMHLCKQFIRRENSHAFCLVGGDEKGTQCQGVQPGLSVHGGYIYGDLALQLGGVSNLRQ